MKSQILIHPEELNKKWIDRMADAGISVIGLHPVGGKGAAASLRELLRSMKDENFRMLLDYAAERGLEIEYEFHAAGYLLDRDLFETHPEYFRMNSKGERTRDYNFCVSNEDALTKIAERAVDLAEQLYRSNPKFYFWLDDHRDAACCCPDCSRFSPSEQQLIVINRMIQEIRKRHPHAQMAYLAYFNTVIPPLKIRPEEGVFLEYAPFEKYVSATDENRQDLIRREEEMIEPLLRHFGKKDAKVLEYWYDNSLFSDWKKPPKRFVLNEDRMKKDIRQYTEKGFEYISTFGCYLGEDYEELYGEPDIRAFVSAVK